MWEWTGPKILAAELAAARTLTYPKIAEQVGVDRSTVYVWRKAPEFQARVAEITAEHRAEARRIGLADKERRLSALNDRWTRLQQVIEERADADEYQEAPGGRTGLLARSLKSLGSGDNAVIVSEYAIDAALLRELREVEKQAAIELGQWDDTSKTPAVVEIVRKARPVDRIRDDD